MKFIPRFGDGGSDIEKNVLDVMKNPDLRDKIFDMASEIDDKGIYFKKIPAIKVIRESLFLGLKEAKECFENIAASLNLYKLQVEREEHEEINVNFEVQASPVLRYPALFEKISSRSARRIYDILMEEAVVFFTAGGDEDAQAIRNMANALCKRQIDDNGKERGFAD